MLNVLFSLFFSIASFGWEADLSLPTPQPVVDEVGLLTSEQRRDIDQLLRDILAKSGVEISVYIAKDLRGMAIEQFSIAVVEQWKLGRKKTDKGLLFLVAPNDRKMRFEVGYGLEGEITDAYSKRVLDQRVRPFFRSGDYYRGILGGLAGIQERVPLGVDLPAEATDGPIPFWLFFIIVMALFLFVQFRRLAAFGFSGGRGRWGGGSWGGGSSGGSWSSGDSGSSWSGGGGSWGGGGGGFGGGGASSNW